MIKWVSIYLDVLIFSAHEQLIRQTGSGVIPLGTFDLYVGFVSSVCCFKMSCFGAMCVYSFRVKKGIDICSPKIS